MKSTVAFEEIKNINAKLKGEHRDFMSHQEAFGSIYQQLSEVKECLADIEKFLEQCLAQIKVNNEDLIRYKYSSIEFAAELLATEATKLASVAGTAKESD